MLGCRQMGESLAPSSASQGAIEAVPPRIEIGVLRNGLGSIRNLELLIKSIKVGQKGLFAAVAAVHADCAPMIANADGLARALIDNAVDTACAERLSNVLSTSLTDLENMLARVVASGRLSVAQRLKLEGDLARCARDLSATLPLVALIERSARPRPLELTPVELVHASSAERLEEKSVTVYRAPSPSAPQCSLSVDLEAAKTLVALAVALVMDGKPEGHPRLSFELQSGGGAVSTVSLAPGDPPRGGLIPGVPIADGLAPGGPLPTPRGLAPDSRAPARPDDGSASSPAAAADEGVRVRIVPLRLSAPSVLCAEVAARRLGARFEFAREARRVCIYWPMA